MIANLISGFHFSYTNFGYGVSFHDYISQYWTGIALHVRPRSEEKQDNAAGKHFYRIASNNLKGYKSKYSNKDIKA